jgi:hypothetical protein
MKIKHMFRCLDYPMHPEILGMQRIWFDKK